MTLSDRAAAFAATYAKWPASHLRVVQEQKRDVLYGTWLIGNDYRSASGYYGSYPPGYVARVRALFPDVADDCLLHAFSGSLPPGEYWRLDSNPENGAEFTGHIYEARALIDRTIADDGYFHLVLADPPYSRQDAEKYGTTMIDRRRALAALADITAPAHHLVWLDTCWPIHSKRQWLTVGRILLQRSTNHRARVVSIFERVAA